MKIQVISYDKKIKYGTEHEYTYSALDEPKSLDAFDVNIIILQTKELWRHKEATKDSIDAIKDFQSLKALISTVKKTKVILCFPQNYIYYHYFFNNTYLYHSPLKDMLPQLKEHLKYLIPQGLPCDLIYENSTTLCNGVEYAAAFYFSITLNEDQKLTRCLGSDHTTTFFAKSNLIFTTLDLSKPETKINDFLKEIGLYEEKCEFPLWINNFKFLDDERQEEIVLEANAEITRQKNKIKMAKEKLEENLHYKSILFETGDALVKVIFEILEKMLNISLSDFVDKKEEDFKIVLPDVTFIGEIKGITSNIKSENISQLEVHCQTYADNLDENEKCENIKGILVINPFRNKPLHERDEVHEKQIVLAEKYGSLIVTTETLLLLFISYLEERISTDDVVELFKSKTGLLAISDFVNEKE